MLLRKADISEIERVMEILADGREALAAAGIDQWQGGYPYRDVIERDIALGQSYVVEDGDGGLIATAVISFLSEKDYLVIEGGEWLTDAPEGSEAYAVVHRVAVAHTAKGKGVASFILEGAEEIAKEGGARSIRVDTHADNTPMRKLLAKEGYTHCGTVYVSHAGELSSARMAFEKILV